MTAAQKKQELIRLFGSYSKRLERLYDQYATDLVGLGLHESLLEEDPLFHFDDFPQHRESLNNIFSDFVRKQLLTIKAAIADGVALAFLHDKGDLQGASVLGNAAITHARETAADAFYRGRMKPQQGLSLSQLVWNYSQQTKSEFEMAMSTVIAGGLQQGTSAEELGRKVRHLLNNPDMMHRRYHEKVLRNGERVDVVTWRRRVIGEDGKVHFVKGPLEKVGRGHYRSARMNAYRLMRSEINMAFHRANHERWMQEPFVIGIHIWPSDQHPMEDVCDELKGDYPKDFLFLGWHPACMDTCTPITLKGDERREYLKRIAKGEDVSGYVSPNRVRDVPDSYKRYIAENADRIISADKRGKLAYHLRDNRKYWEEIVARPENYLSLADDNILVSENQPDIERSLEKFFSYGSEWEKAYFNYTNGGYNVYHQSHLFSSKKDRRARYSGGEAEKVVGKKLADYGGKQVEFLPEKGFEKKKADMAFDGTTWDVKYIPIANVGTIRKYIKNGGSKAANIIFYWDDDNRLGDLKIAVSRTIGALKSKRILDLMPNILYIGGDNELKYLYKK